MLITALLTAFAVAPTPSPDEPGQDGVVATAPATAVVLDGAEAPVAPEVGGATQSAPHGLNTDQQIARWLAARSEPAASHDDSPVWRDDRGMHGEFSVGVGTGGYRDYAAAVSLPIGESGRLDIGIRQTENGYPYRYGHEAGYDPYFADSGYVFPGQSAPGASLDYERHLSRPEGPPNRWPSPRPQQASEE